MRKFIGLIAIIFCLVGCATKPSAPTVTYYLLDQAQSAAEVSGARQSVAIAPVFVAEYLSLPNLVLKQSDHRIIVANYHLWAEPLPPSIKRALMNDLSIANRHVSFVDRCSNCDRVNVYVDHFYPEEEGDAVFSGRYTISRRNGVIENYPFSQRAPLAADGYAAAVRQMRQLVRQLSQRITTSL